MSEYQHIHHTFEPVYNSDSTILILGSLPSVKSREDGFYYGHPRNRFWKVIVGVAGENPEQKLTTIEDKKNFLLEHHIALWDVIESCDIIGSSDSSIKNVIPNDIGKIIKESNIQKIYANGKTAGNLYRKYVYPLTHIEIIDLPSTSPANATFTYERLYEAWKIINKGVRNSE